MPYPNEHSARLMSPDSEHIRVARTKGGKVQGVQVPNTISVIWYIQKKEGKEVPIPQALRFPTKRWTADAAKSWLSKNKIKYIKFEAAERADKDAADSIPCYVAYVDKAKKKLDIILHQDIGLYGMQSQKFYEMLSENSDVEDIHIDINSRGGSVYDGFSIYNALKAHNAEVSVKISGVAASIASVIAMSASPGKLEMPENATMMIHKPYIPYMIGADADKLRKEAEALDKLEKGIIAAYRSRLGKTDMEIAEMLKETTWFTAQEAKDAGLADVITEEIEVDNYLDLLSIEEHYGKVPDAVLNMYDIERNDSLDFNINDEGDKKIFDLISKFFKLKKERESMDNAELEKKVNGLVERVDTLENKNKDLEAENNTLKSENDTLKETIKNQTEATEKKAKEVRTGEYRSFCENLVKEGKMVPASVDIQVETLEMRFLVDKENQKNGSTETPLVDAYKKMLNELPVSFPVGEEHVASNEQAKGQNVSAIEKDPLSEAAKKIVNEAKIKGLTIAYSDAVKQAYEENPGLYSKENQFVEQK